MVFLFWTNRNFELVVFVKRSKSKNPEKNSRRKARTINKLNPRMVQDRNRTQATSVRGEFFSVSLIKF